MAKILKLQFIKQREFTGKGINIASMIATMWGPMGDITAYVDYIRCTSQVLELADAETLRSIAEKYLVNPKNSGYGVYVSVPGELEKKNADTKIEASAQQRAVVIYASYARVSRNTEDQLQSFASRLRCYNTLFTDSSSEILVELYADEGLTGTDLEKRTDFKRMISDARQHKFDRIICKSVTRLARNTKDCLSAIRELKSLGITVYFEENKIDTMAVSGEVLITLLGLSAQNESVSISKNERWSIRNRMANGTYVAYRK